MKSSTSYSEQELLCGGSAERANNFFYRPTHWNITPKTVREHKANCCAVIPETYPMSRVLSPIVSATPVEEETDRDNSKVQRDQKTHPWAKLPAPIAIDACEPRSHLLSQDAGNESHNRLPLYQSASYLARTPGKSPRCNKYSDICVRLP